MKHDFAKSIHAEPGRKDEMLQLAVLAFQRVG
jgi:hypothetical protein